MNRKPLGRGLSALLGDAPAAVATQPDQTERVAEIDIDLISPNPHQPRTRFTEQALDELAQSIIANGIVQPIVVRPKDGRYEVIAGKRRWRAAQRAALRKVPAVIKEVPDEKLLELALIENIQRQELNPIDEARAYQKLIEEFGLTQDELSERVGRERSLIATTVRLLRLPEDVQKLIEEEKLSASHGRALLMTDSPAVQRRVARKIIEEGLSVRATERRLKRTSKAETIENKGVSQKKDPNIT